MADHINKDQWSSRVARRVIGSRGLRGTIQGHSSLGQVLPDAFVLVPSVMRMRMVALGKLDSTGACPSVLIGFGHVLCIGGGALVAPSEMGCFLAD